MSSASTSQPVQSTSAAVEHTKDDDVPHLGVLEEDDEFEEFSVAGMPRPRAGLATTLCASRPLQRRTCVLTTRSACSRLGRFPDGPRSLGRHGAGRGEVGWGQAVGG